MWPLIVSRPSVKAQKNNITHLFCSLLISPREDLLQINKGTNSDVSQCTIFFFYYLI